MARLHNWYGKYFSTYMYPADLILQKSDRNKEGLIGKTCYFYFIQKLYAERHEAIEEKYWPRRGQSLE